MSENVMVVGRNCDTIAAEIVAITAQAKQIVVSSAIEVGRRLVEAKEMVGHGQWGSYVVQLCGMSHSSANNCMRLFKEWEANPNSQALANFSYTNALRLLSMPEEDREVVLQNEDAPNMSARELDRLAKELAAERAARETAEADLKALEKKAKPPKHWQVELDREKRKSEDLKKELAKAKSQGPSPEELQKLQAEAMEKARQEFAEEIAKAKAEADAILKEARDAQAAAAEAVKAAEAETESVRKQLDGAKKSELLADPDVANLNAACERIREAFNVAHGYLKKIAGRDPEKGEKLRAALVKLLDLQKETIGGGEGG